MPGLAKGIRPPSGIKKEDRLESLVAPVVNRKKMYIKREHQDLVDEMFQFPKGKNDDLLDGLWYAIVNAKAPVSRKFDSEDFDKHVEKKSKKSTKKTLISWVTGQKI